MGQQNLIDELVDDLKPFKKSAPFYIYWIFTAVCLLGFAIYFIQKSYFVKIGLNLVFVEIVGLLSLGAWGLYHGFRFSDPMTHKVRNWESILSKFVILSFLSIYFSTATDTSSYFQYMSVGRAKVELSCSLELLANGLMIGLVSIFFFRKLAPLKIAQISFYGMVGAMAYATMFLRILCGSSSAQHFLVWHYTPAFLGFGLGFLGMKWCLGRIIA